MKVIRLCWLGIATDEYREMRRLFRDVMGLQVEFELPATIELSVPGSDDRVQLFAPGDRYFDFLKAQSTGPVVGLFEVDDVRAARAELDAAGFEVLGGLEQDEHWEWLHFRAPDGSLYALATRLAHAGGKPA